MKSILNVPRSQDTSIKRFPISREALPFFSATFLAMFVTVLEEFSFSHQQGLFLGFLLEGKGLILIPGLLSTLFSFLILVTFFWLSLRLSRPARIIFLIVFAVPVVVEFGYWKVFGRAFSSLDLATALASPPQVWQDAVKLYFHAMVPVILAMYAVPLFLHPSRSAGPKPAVLALIMLACFGLNAGFQAASLPTNWGTTLPRFYKTLTQWSLSSTRSIQRKSIQFSPTVKPGNNIVLIIDESIRADHLEINGYERDTTPYLVALAQKTDLFANWGVASSGATCSQLSNALLITGTQLTGQSKDRVLEQVAQMPTIFDYAYAAGYKTYYLDAQTNILWNGLNIVDLKNITEWVNTNQLGKDLQVDQRAAGWIHQKVTTSTGSFIVLNKKGVHFLYEDSYPEEETIWSPVPSDYHTQPELVKNVYDNGIRYNVDRFFQALIPQDDRSLENTLYVYTSDHGQTLFENGANWLHCNYYPAEARVPLFILGRLPKQPNMGIRVSHANIFATLLDLMQVPPEARAHLYAQSLLDPASGGPARLFVSGDGTTIDFDQ